MRRTTNKGNRQGDQKHHQQPHEQLCQCSHHHGISKESISTAPEGTELPLSATGSAPAPS
jgi:hypothetical protein